MSDGVFMWRWMAVGRRRSAGLRMRRRCWAGLRRGTVKLMSVGEEMATARLREVILEAAGDGGRGADERDADVHGAGGDFAVRACGAWAERTLRGMVWRRADACAGMRRLRWMRRFGVGRGCW